MFQRNTHHVILYGTLRQNVKGSRFNSFKLGQDLKYERDCLVRGKLIYVNPFPALVLTNEDKYVLGELYSFINPYILTYLDGYEGYDPKNERESLYIRRQIVTIDPDFLNTFVYVWNDKIEGYPEIESGDWAQYAGRI
jgi:gamma-glutamylcyclotransferase (GGCT)/AIG2-like uncharacterized protein YtfP